MRGSKAVAKIGAVSAAALVIDVAIDGASGKGLTAIGIDFVGFGASWASGWVIDALATSAVAALGVAGGPAIAIFAVGAVLTVGASYLCSIGVDKLKKEYCN